MADPTPDIASACASSDALWWVWQEWAWRFEGNSGLKQQGRMRVCVRARARELVCVRARAQAPCTHVEVLPHIFILCIPM
jgi:hypothetical protein